MSYIVEETTAIKIMEELKHIDMESYYLIAIKYVAIIIILPFNLVTEDARQSTMIALILKRFMPT